MKPNIDRFLKNTFVFIIFSLMVVSCKNQKKIDEKNMKEVKEEAPFFKLSLAQWSVHKLIKDGKMDPFDFAQVAKEMGFEAVEYVDELYEKEIDSMGFDAVIERLKQESEKHGIKNLLIMVDGAGDLADPDLEKIDRAVELHKKYVDAAVSLGCHSIRVNTFGTNDPEEWVKSTEVGLRKLSEYAATKGINVLVENHGWLSSDAPKVVEVIKAVNMPNCGTLPDFGNWCVKRKDGEKWGECIEEYPDIYNGMELIMPFAKAVSAKSFDFNETGDETKIDYTRMLQIVKDAGFTGYIGVEYEGELLSEEAGIKATKDLLINAAKKLN